MNRTYSYGAFDEWQDKGETRKTALEALIQKLGELKEDRTGLDEDPRWHLRAEEVKLLPEYHYKAGCINMPEIVGQLKNQGLYYESLEMGGIRWLVVMPEDVLEHRDVRLPLVLVFHKERYEDPYWAMKTLVKYQTYIECAAREKNMVLLYLVSNMEPWEPCHMFSGIITEGIQNYCGDRERVYVDISQIKENSLLLKDIEPFPYTTKAGEPVEDPDEAIEVLNGIPVLNFSWRWVTPWHPTPLGSASDGTADVDWLFRSETGKKLLRQQQFALKYYSVKDPGVQEYWKSIGLQCNCHYIHEERWVIFTPTGTGTRKLPVVVALDEVNEPNDHGPVRAFANYRTYGEIAAQGDCALIFFAMESPKLNDWICEILQDAARQYPIDLTRVYLTGHSHNGHFVQEFARRHPEVVACIAPLGNSPGLPTPEVSHEAVSVDDARAQRMEQIDMPTCILCGCKEVGCLVPVNQAGHAFEAGINVDGYAASAEGKIVMWNRRLKAECCEMQDPEAVMQAARSQDRAERALGFPADRTEIVYLDGVEHYVGDIQNKEGRYHFRVVAIENLPHMVSPSMNLMAWNYMRRFARNLETGEVIEL